MLQVSPARIGNLLAGFGIACALVLGGCAGYNSPAGLKVGATEDEVTRVMGPPTGRYTMPAGGTRLEFARGPLGYATYMLNFDPAGGLVDWEQVMDLSYLWQIASGMTKEEVLMRIGHPVTSQTYPRQQVEVWNYRYNASDCRLWFQITIGQDGKVISGGQGIDPRCDPGDSRPGGFGR
jgi:outer membrane protein assembly factor BamE (lipoprotein component of BamABCDE complex)